MSEWQPIESAPKKLPVLVAQEGQMPIRARQTWDGCWRAHSPTGPDYNLVASEAPTHWMPLPPPPSTRSE